MKNLLVAVFAAVSLAFAPIAAMAATPWPLGVFPPVTAYSGGYSTLQTFSAQMGVTQPAIENFYEDFSQLPTSWLSSSDYNMGGFDNASVNGGPNNCTNPWFACSGVIPMGDIPMNSSNASAPSPDQVMQNYIAGDYDSELQGMVQHWYAQGYHTQYWRPGVEMNETNSSSCGTNAQCLSDWRGAFQHIYTVMHAEASSIGATIQIVWNPGADAGGVIDPTLSNAYWPGASYVDIIGLDLYGNAYPDNSTNPCPNYTTPSTTTCEAAWTAGGNALGLQEALTFAHNQGKPVGFPETGAGGNNDGTSASGNEDNPLFAQWLSSVLRNNPSTTIAFVSLWDSNGGCTCGFTPASSSGKPNEAAAFATYFGNGATGTVHTPSTPTAANTQVNGPIGQIITDTVSTTWNINLSEQITENGAVVASSANVATLFWTGSQLDQYNTNGQWYTQPLDGTAGTAISAPSGYIAPTAASPANTTTNVSSGVIYDTWGNKWAINSGGQETVNGTAVASSSGVVHQFWTGTALDQLNNLGSWYTQPLDGSTGAAIAAPAGYNATTIVAITVAPSTATASTSDYTPIKPFSSIVITDPNASQTESATVSLSATANGTLSDPNAPGDSSSITAGVLTIPATTAAALATDIDGIVFTPTLNQTANGVVTTTTITATVTDNPGAQSATSVTTVSSTQVTVTHPFVGSHCG